VPSYLSLTRLTKSERAILFLLTDTTLTQPLVAEQLGISINTVKSHVRSIYQKFGVSSRTETIDYATNAGLLLSILPWCHGDTDASRVSRRDSIV